MESTATLVLFIAVLLKGDDTTSVVGLFFPSDDKGGVFVSSSGVVAGVSPRVSQIAHVLWLFQ